MFFALIDHFQRAIQDEAEVAILSAFGTLIQNTFYEVSLNLINNRFMILQNGGINLNIACKRRKGQGKIKSRNPEGS